ncbi:MAG: hypothetical protein CMD58_02855 [Gammaproteobacteria bacterium]|nr:hypothetical protein [Gammaproteobacteria bacterium]
MKKHTDNNFIEQGSLELSQWRAIKVLGNHDNARDFLQGQITSDVNLVSNNSSQLSCICDHKGQVIADFILYKLQEEFYILINKDFVNIFCDELKVFSKFSSVEFQLSNKKIIGQILKKGEAKNFYSKNDTFQVNVFLKNSDYHHKNTLNLDHWYVANKLLGILFLDKSDSRKFRPLEINYDSSRVSFEKGCFRGQEIVARMKYLGVNRRQFLTFIADDKFKEENHIKIVGKIIKINDKKIFNGIIKRDDIEKIKKNIEIIYF